MHRTERVSVDGDLCTEYSSMEEWMSMSVMGWNLWLEASYIRVRRM
jgi:hypothetical protein